MKNQRDKLHQYQKRITKLTDRETEIAKECLARGQKAKALLALRRKKYQESLLAKTDLQLEQLQQLTSDVEFASVQKDVVFGLKQGTAVLKQIHAEMGGIENVEKLLGENEEARAYQKEIGDMLSGKMSNEDEDEVENELEALQNELDDLKEGPKIGLLPDAPKVRLLPNAPKVRLLPDAPKEDPVADEEDDALLEKQRKARARARAREQADVQAMEPVAV